MKKCSYCAEEIQGEAIKCKHCNSLLGSNNNKENLRTQQNAPYKIAGIAKRLFNFIIDSIGSFLLMGIFSVFFYSEDINELGSLVILLISFFGYYLFFEWKWGKTPAKFITSTKVVMLDGSKVDFSHILVRTILRYIPFDWLSVLFYKKTIFWHDSLAKTRVVDDK